MNRISLGFSLAASTLGLALLALPHKAAAQMFFPVIHPEPITVHVVDSRDGHPMARLHVVLVAGYDRSDLEKHVWHEAVMTDDEGVIHLPATMLNLPWLGVLMPKSSTCKTDPRIETFSVEQMRLDGLSAPNRCGTATWIDHPGEFVVFADKRAQAQKHRDGREEAVTASNARDFEVASLKKAQ
jgi:hypothetical protein